MSDFSLKILKPLGSLTNDGVAVTCQRLSGRLSMLMHGV